MILSNIMMIMVYQSKICLDQNELLTNNLNLYASILISLTHSYIKK